MLHLEKIGLGTVKQTERSDYFYKVLPSVVNGETLTNFGLPLEEYSRQFNKQDDGLTNSQKEAAVDNHPNGEAYDAYIASQNSQKWFPVPDTGQTTSISWKLTFLF